MENKRAVAAYINYYLNNVTGSIEDIGYFSASADAQQESFTTWERATGLTQSTAENLYPATGDIVVSGSSTVAPISRQMAENFQAAGGYTGNITVESIGTEAGFKKFCVDRSVDVVDASIAIPEVYSAACINAAMSPVTFQIGTDALPLVVSTKNTFVEALTTEQVQRIFTKATTWNEVDQAWPADKIFRFIPGAESGTLDFFIEEVFGTNLYEQPVEVMNEILAANLSAGRMRALEAEKPMATRSQEEIGKILQTEVVKPKVVQTWGLFESIFRRNEVLAEAATLPAGTDLVFKSWLNWNFLTSPQSSNPLQAGINTAIWGSLWVTIIAFLVAVPIGVMAAIYLEEYSDGKGRVNRIIETNINNLAGVPSIIYGMLGLAVFVRFLGEITSGVAFGVTDPATANGRTILSAGLTLGILILPLIIINSREALRAVPRAIREGAYGLGATRWQTTWSHVLPNALPGIMTGIILSVSRAFGETAPLIVVGVSTFIVVRPDSMFSKYTTLPAQIYQWTSRPQPEFQNLAAAAILALLLLLLALNATAILVRNHYAKRV
ncbi:MAG: phosphate ABC transporter permease PstA [Anaerolineales bacterium]|nr:phosphate ABC transporter permease PstA [Anaerolineales bacterium]